MGFNNAFSNGKTQTWATSLELGFTAGMQGNVTDAGKFLEDQVLVIRSMPIPVSRMVTSTKPGSSRPLISMIPPSG